MRLKQRKLIEEYNKQGWNVIPVKGKIPIGTDWTNKRYNKEEIEKIFFNGKIYNIGVLLGKASNNLIDIDLDCEEAIQLAPYFLPETAIFGREGKKKSHYLYYCEGANTKQYIQSKERMLLELRSTGGQTVFPGSTHTSGEEIEWSNNKSPVCLDKEDIRKFTGDIAAIILLKDFWKEGIRQNLSLCLTGLLLNQGRTEEEVSNIIQGICLITGDTDVNQRLSSITTTKKRREQDKTTSGLPTLESLTSVEAVTKLKDWLQIKPGEFATLNLTGPVSSLEPSQSEEKEKEPTSLLDFMLSENDLNIREDWFIQEILAPDTITTIYSKAGGGKSFFSLLVSLQLLEVGKIDTAIYLDNDNSKRALKSRGIDLIQKNTKNFIYIPSHNVTGKLLPIFEKELREKKYGHSLIIVDSIRNFLKGDPNSDTDAMVFMDLVKLWRNLGNTIILLHHVNKNEKIKNSTSIGDYSDIVYKMESENNRLEKKLTYTMTVEKNRIGVKEEFSGTIDCVNLKLTIENTLIDLDDQDILECISNCLSSGKKKQYEIIDYLAQHNYKRKDVISEILAKYSGQMWTYEKGSANSKIFSPVLNAPSNIILNYSNNIKRSSFLKIQGKTGNSIIPRESEKETEGNSGNSVMTPFVKETLTTSSFLQFPVVFHETNGVDSEFPVFPINRVETENNSDSVDVKF